MATQTEPITKKISRLKQLPTLPFILRELFDVLQNEQSTFVDIARVIKHDQTITERILRVANSPYFGHSGNVYTLEQAIMFLGYELVKGICLGTSVFKLLDNGKKRTFSNLWRHSYEVGIIAANLSDHVSTIDPSVSFVSGLLHDIGRVVLLTIDMERYLCIISSDDIILEEDDSFGIDHTIAGARFIEKAQLPGELILSVRYHHSPYDAPKYRKYVSVIAVAEALSRGLFPRDEDDGGWKKEHDTLLDELGLNEEMIKNTEERAVRQALEMNEMMGC